MLRHHRSAKFDTEDTPFSHAVIDDRYAHLSGIVAADVPEGAKAIGDFRDETRVVMKAIKALLAELDLGLEDLVRVQVHITDMERFDEMNQVYRDFFEEGRYPARTCTEIWKLAGGSNVEVTCTARLRNE